MAAAMRLLVDGPQLVFIAALAIVTVLLEVFMRSSAGLLFQPGFPALSWLLAVTMIQKFSVPEKFRSVSTTAYGDEKQRVRKLNLRGPVARLLAKTAVGTPRPPLSQYKTCDQLQSVNRRSTTIAGAISKRLEPGSIEKTS
jgi:hypothetical protein